VDIEEQLRAVYLTVMKTGRTGYAVAKAAGMKPEILYRFARGGDLRLKTAAKLAAVLGLTLTVSSENPNPPAGTDDPGAASVPSHSSGGRTGAKRMKKPTRTKK
jgi:hypothetical protein